MTIVHLKSYAKNLYHTLQAHILVTIGRNEARTIDDFKRPSILYRMNIATVTCTQLFQYTIAQK